MVPKNKSFYRESNCICMADSETYLTSSPAKSKTLVMVTLAGSDAFVSELKGATFNNEDSA